MPNETRQAFRDGTNGFERILPGPQRMYPDTDSPPTRITRDRVQALNDALPPPQSLDPRSGALLRTLEGATARTLAYAPDGSWLASGNDGG